MKRIASLLLFLFGVSILAAADLTVTATSVVAGANTKAQGDLTAAESITAGAVVYRITSSTVGLATATNATKANVFGIALNGGAVGQPIKITTEDSDFTVGATMTTGMVLVLSSAPGKIAPSGDLTNSWYPTVLGVANSNTKASIKVVKGTNAIP